MRTQPMIYVKSLLAGIMMALLLYVFGMLFVHFYAQYAVASLNANATNGDSYFVVETFSRPSLQLADLPLLLAFAGGFYWMFRRSSVRNSN